MDIKGTIVEIGEIETKGASNFQVRTFVIEVPNYRDPQYNDFIEFQATGQRCTLLDNFKVGQMVSVSFDIRGRKWVGKENQVRYFNTLTAWNIQPDGQTTVNATPPVKQDGFVDLDFSASPTDNDPF